MSLPGQVLTVFQKYSSTRNYFKIIIFAARKLYKKKNKWNVHVVSVNFCTMHSSAAPLMSLAHLGAICTTPATFSAIHYIQHKHSNIRSASFAIFDEIREKYVVARHAKMSQCFCRLSRHSPCECPVNLQL